MLALCSLGGKPHLSCTKSSVHHYVQKSSIFVSSPHSTCSPKQFSLFKKVWAKLNQATMWHGLWRERFIMVTFHTTHFYSNNVILCKYLYWNPLYPNFWWCLCNKVFIQFSETISVFFYTQANSLSGQSV